MKKTMTSIWAMSLAACTALASCSDTSHSSEAESSLPAVSESSTGISDISEAAVTDSYKLTEMELPFEFDYLSIMAQLDDGLVLIASIDDGSGEGFYIDKYYRTDSSLTKFEEISFDKPSETETADNFFTSCYFNTDGSFAAMYTLEDHGGVTLPRGYDESFDYDAYYENCKSSYMLCFYDSDGAMLSSAVIDFPEEMYDHWGYLSYNSVIADGSSMIITDNSGGIHRISSDGSFTSLREGSEQYEYISLFRDRDGKLICFSENIRFCQLDENGSMSEPICPEDIGVSGYDTTSPTAGFGEYRILISKEEYLYGITDGGEAVQLINWSASNTTPLTVYPIGNGEYFTIANDMTEDGLFLNKPMKLVPRDPAELESMQEITIGSPYGYLPREIINSFNSSQSEYHLQSVRQDSYEDYNDAEKQFNMDIISGNAPDIIFDISCGYFMNLQKKGVFADIYELIDNDSELSRDDFMPNLLSALEYSDGKLYTMPKGFSVSTLVTKTSVWDKENWTFDEMMGLYDDPPASSSHLYTYDSKEDMFNAMLYTMESLIDYDKAVCHFDSPEFITMLKFCDRFVDEVDMPDKETEQYDHQMFYYNKFMRLQNDEILTEQLTFGPVSEYSKMKNLQAGGADLTFAGYPSDDGNGGRITPSELMCINSQCSNKEAAWSFIKYYMEETSKPSVFETGDSWGIPSLEANFDALLDREAYAIHSASGYEYPALNKDEREMIKEYILSCGALGTSLDDDTYNICLEEARTYFGGGQSAETAAEHIQNRVSILVSERS